jgi:hypothetical protein
MHTLRYLMVVALAVAGAAVTGCTNSSSALLSTDGGSEDGSMNKDTNGTSTPSTDLGASLEDSQQQSCFKSLF